MAKKVTASKRATPGSVKAGMTPGRIKGTADSTASATLRKQIAELRRENETLHRQLARYEVSNFSLKNRAAALEEILQDTGHIENPRLKRLFEEVQERTRGAGDLLDNGPF